MGTGSAAPPHLNVNHENEEHSMTVDPADLEGEWVHCVEEQGFGDDPSRVTLKDGLASSGKYVGRYSIKRDTVEIVLPCEPFNDKRTEELIVLQLPADFSAATSSLAYNSTLRIGATHCHGYGNFYRAAAVDALRNRDELAGIGAGEA